ncbi:MAG TPA: [protein-PII] uridylyltransferase [Kofleriaceae bacterium]|nr:[protein-PII] uridylyltransferase [Kofleriaceae bacterium]
MAPSTLRSALDAVIAAQPAVVRVAGQGGAACRALAEVYDREIAARFTAAVHEVGGERASLALVATGGWARRELAPYSDIDFIVLHDRDPAVAKAVCDRLLYPLWDDKLAIGHAVREPRALATLAKGDLATATALLDARHIAGERWLLAELTRVTLATLAPSGNPNALIAQLAAVQKARHERFGASLYLLEPNLKQGIGGLRDLATALWAAQIRWRPPRPIASSPDEEAGDLVAYLVAHGQLTARQAQILVGARDFQLRVRALVQLTARRRVDQLTFEIQEAIAPALYGGEGAPAVEALMRDYYLHARGVLEVAERLLERARVPPRARPRIAEIDAGLLTLDGELALRDPRRFEHAPSEIVRVFRVAVERRLAVAGHTRELAAETLARDPAPLAGDRTAAALFVDALVDPRDDAQPSALEAMNQLGVLSALLPGWAPCVGRVQHDLYHVYTVDQHQLYAVAMQKRLARGELADAHPLATELWRAVRRPAPLLLATLLHDVGKPLGKGHAEKGAVIAEACARRLGLTDGDAALTAFLVRQHLTMSHLSQRRDLSDPEVIARFADKLGDDEHLVQLYLLSLCDAAMTAPDNLTAWKADLLRELFVRTRAHLAGGAAAQVANVAELGALGDALDPRLFTQLAPRQLARCVALVAEARAAAPAIALAVHGVPDKGHSELAIVAPDAPGVLATLAGALTAHRIDVLGAVLGRAGDLVCDTFFVRDLKGAAITDDDPRWPRLTADVTRLLTAGGAPDVAQLIARRRPPSSLPRRVTPPVPTAIRLHDDSTQATIVEVSTRDRVGVLYAITRCLADLGLDISLAKVATEGEAVADVFYVTRGRARLTDEADRARVIGALHAALGEPAAVGGAA